VAKQSQLKKILFIGHVATRTGAPYVLLHLLRWLRANTSIECRLLLGTGGELEPEFAKVAQTLVLDSREIFRDNIITKGLRYYGFRRDGSSKYLARLKRELINEGIDLIYSNTAANAQIVASLEEARCPVVTHVHELEYVIRHVLDSKTARLMRESTRHYIAVSESVRRNLIENHAISENKIDLIYEFIPVQMVDSDRKAIVRRKVRQELGMASEDFVVGGSGTIEWRKGPDLFVQLASMMSRLRLDRPVWFVWLGGKIDETIYNQLFHDIRLLGLENSVRFLGASDDALKYIGAFDVFAMVSREDPFPLVCLEAASMGVPIVCFDKAGGTCEFVDTDSGFVVPYLDLVAMADKVSALLNSEDLRLRYGRQAAHKVRRLHDIEVAAPKILEVLQRLV